ncbi:SGNH/GDSL hydrolase family protein [Egicoccus halophilus]|uniref:SGNH hydrolase n=1 Tax=Egicoccus halophilus TaxID=1670830 RepID=A0A8J3AB19_9ACTN|nr:SGNH/GDSL hydrolase family protein [Egicoccus halophilus]GGI06947.1 SGNH hydrolase [Egicoccus halophilus]
MEVRRFVACGDSFTEGLHDELGPDGRHRGWSDRVAEGLARANADGTLSYANLAVRGKLLDEVVADQLPAALALDADVFSFHAGGNDVLRPKVEVEALVRRYEQAVRELRAGGAEVVLFTVLERAGGTGRLADALARKFALFNAGVRRTAQRTGARLVDVGGVAALQDRRVWDEDRLHLAPEGHRRVAGAVLEVLGIDDEAIRGGPVGWWRTPLPSGVPAARTAKLAGDVRWVRRHLLPWVGRRVRGVSSGDAVACKRPEPVQVRAEA